MSLSEIERFVADSATESGLRAALAATSSLEQVVSIAREHDYLISIDDVRAHLGAGPALQVSDERLDAQPEKAISCTICGGMPPAVVLVA
ncbi:MAG: Nif11-like leader peptide family natural product precursor [Alphaproteobacteria bacterium]|nr:Nif11-like leader peptide family natural product precursor [Alphaproteobacteria bacterium]